MSKRRNTTIATVSSILLLAFSAIPSFASATPNMVTKEQLTIKIPPAAGTVWGTVSLKPAQKGGKCAKATCKYKVAKGTKLTLKETAKNSSTWPFCDWKVNGKKKGTTATLHVKIPAKSTVVSALYTLPGQCK